MFRFSLVVFWAVAAVAQSLSDLSTTPLPLRRGDTLVVGFLGAWEHWDDENRSVRKLALKLRDKSIPGVYVETLANYRRKVALNLIRKALDANGDGSIDRTERSSVRIILYGQSLGGLAVVKLARELEAMQVPVQLTVQIDSVGLTDEMIPPNVLAAANLYQDGRLSFRGQAIIRAADPKRTSILENTRFDYARPSPVQPETWARRRLGGWHARMEADPAVWIHVERLILDNLKAIQ